MSRRPDPNAYVPPEGWDVWTAACEMNRRRAAQREREALRKRQAAEQ